MIKVAGTVNRIACINGLCSKIAAPVLLTLICGFSLSSFAAQDGEIGFESTGSIFINLTIEQGVQITGLEDWDITVSRENNGSNREFTKDFCVRGTIGSRISVTAWTDTTAGNNFALTSSNNEALPFSLEFNPAIAIGQYEELTPNNASSVYTINDENNCNAGNTSEIKIVFEEEDILSAENLEFGGDLYITIELL